MFNPMAGMQGPSHHGSAEQRYNTAFDMGGGIGQMTPPISPRRTTSPRSRPGLELPSTRSPSVKRHADDGHERRRSRERYRQRHDDDEQPLPQSWGARMLATETKVRTLEESLESVKKVIEETHNGINVKVDQMKGFVQEVEGRFTQLERAVPERFHALEVKEETTKILINELATSIRLKFNELEESIKARPAPPIPPSFGGSAPERPEHFHVGFYNECTDGRSCYKAYGSLGAVQTINSWICDALISVNSWICISCLSSRLSGGTASSCIDSQWIEETMGLQDVERIRCQDIEGAQTL